MQSNKVSIATGCLHGRVADASCSLTLNNFFFLNRDIKPRKSRNRCYNDVVCKKVSGLRLGCQRRTATVTNGELLPREEKFLRVLLGLINFQGKKGEQKRETCDGLFH